MNRDILTVNDGLLKEDGTRTPSCKFNTYEYSGVPELDADGNEVEGKEQPKFLTNPNYYFMKTDEKKNNIGLEDISDTEMQE